MIFTVIWDPSADNGFIRLWLEADDQQAMTDASQRIERELRAHPDAKGIPFGQLFVYTDDPLAVLYSVSPKDRLVRIIAVKVIQ